MSKKSAKEDIPADDPELETIEAEGLEEGEVEETEAAAEGAPGDAAKAVIPARRPDFSLSHDEEMGGIACGHKAVGVEHQRFVCSRLGCLNTGGYAVEL